MLVEQQSFVEKKMKLEFGWVDLLSEGVPVPRRAKGWAVKQGYILAAWLICVFSEKAVCDAHTVS